MLHPPIRIEAERNPDCQEQRTDFEDREDSNESYSLGRLFSLQFKSIFVGHLTRSSIVESKRKVFLFFDCSCLPAYRM